LDDRGTNRETTTHRPTDEERGIASAEKKKPEARKQPAKAVAPSRASVDVLYLHHSSKGELERDENFGKIRYPGAKRIRIISWKHLSQVLGRYDKIGTLVLMTHGHEGGLQIDGSKDGADAGAFLAKTGAQATTILFEGCMIMRSPIEGAQVAQGLKATTATGYNWWHYQGMQEFKLPGAPADQKTVDLVDAWIKPNSQFIMRRPDGTLTQPNTTSAVIDELEKKVKALAAEAKKAKKKSHASAVRHLFTEWFHPDGTGSIADPDADLTRGELTVKHIDNKADAVAFQKLNHPKAVGYLVTVDVNKLVPKASP
jgi:hypothetical protein